MTDQAEETRDAIFHGRISVWQARRGYRFNFDSLVLARWAAVHGRGDTFVDIGSGTGVIAMALATLRPESRGVAIERQPQMVARLRRNLDENGLADRVRVVEGDIRVLAAALGPVDLAVMNPPYFDPGASVVSSDPERAAARHRLHGDLQGLIGAAAACAPAGAIATLCAPVDAAAAIAAAMARGLRAVRARGIVPFLGTQATAILLHLAHAEEARVETDAPFVTYAAPGVYSAEAQDVVSGAPVGGAP